MTTTTYAVQLTDSPGSMTADVVHIEATSERAAFKHAREQHPDKTIRAIASL